MGIITANALSILNKYLWVKTDGDNSVQKQLQNWFLRVVTPIHHDISI